MGERSPFLVGFELEGSIPVPMESAREIVRHMLRAAGVREDVDIGFDATAAIDSEHTGIEIRTPPLPADEALRLFETLCDALDRVIATGPSAGVHVTISAPGPLKAVHAAAIALTKWYVRNVEATGGERTRTWARRVAVVARALRSGRDPEAAIDALVDLLSRDREWSVRERRHAPMLEFRAFGGTGWQERCPVVSARVRGILRMLARVAAMTERAVREAAKRRMEREPWSDSGLVRGMIEEAVRVLSDHARDPRVLRVALGRLDPSTLSEVLRVAGRNRNAGVVAAGFALYAAGIDPYDVFEDVPGPDLGPLFTLSAINSDLPGGLPGTPPGPLGDWAVLLAPRDMPLDRAPRRPAIEDLIERIAHWNGLTVAIEYLSDILPSRSVPVLLDRFVGTYGREAVERAIANALREGTLRTADADVLRSMVNARGGRSA